ncbi:amidohydrolase family protein [Mangrovicoccus ximenensis]|uniref:amidohydrolase family protein n=1 Tax=Mangrovicoccus ximenensis TaxID=1911570 RepID=UPI001F3FFCBB|nr:amidohydrolase family protein [Mangrovicoccus ximenensis]
MSDRGPGWQASGRSGVCGHARGLAGGDLAGFAAAGVETDHELTGADDLIAKLEAGFTIELRGSHEHLLPELAAALLELGELPQTVTLCTDDIFPDDLLERGALDRVIRVLISCGLPPLWAYRAATLNAASRIGRPDLGLVAPGRRADLGQRGGPLWRDHRARRQPDHGAPGRDRRQPALRRRRSPDRAGQPGQGRPAEGLPRKRPRHTLR